MEIIRYLISGIFLFFLSSQLSAQQSTKQDTLREIMATDGHLNARTSTNIGTIAQIQNAFDPGGAVQYNIFIDVFEDEDDDGEKDD